MTSTEIIFEVCEDQVEGGFNARALGHHIFTQGDTVEEVRAMARDAVACHFGERQDRPLVIRLHFVRGEVWSA